MKAIRSEASRRNIAVSALIREAAHAVLARNREETEMIDIINLTPHTINVINDGGEVVAFPSWSGPPARVDTTTREAKGLPGHAFAIRTREMGEITGLPEPTPDTVYIVSAMVASAAWAAGRRDVLCPGELVRVADGRPVGCRGLICHPSGWQA